MNCLSGRELEVVHELLTTSLSTPCVLLEPSDLASAPISLDLGTGLLDLAGGWVRPVVAWVRHTEPGTTLSQASATHVADPLAAMLWSEFLHQLGRAAHVTLPGAHVPRLDRLVDAARLGVRIPRTVVTTDVDAARLILDVPQVVVKHPDFRAFVAGPTTWPAHLPRVLRRGERTGPAGRTAGPVLVQEYLAPATEYRVYVTDGALCAFRVDKAFPAHPWTDPSTVTVAQVPCPPGVAAAVHRLSAAWNLRFAAFDMLVPPESEPVFLEVNLDGDWLWFEHRAHWHGVSIMAAVMLKELFLRRTPREVAPG